MNICTYNDEDLNTNRTKNSQNSGSIRVQPSIPTYKRCFIKSKCINRESHLVFDKDLLSKHACTHFHIMQGQEQPRFAFAFCSWCECYHTNRMWDFPTRLTTEKKRIWTLRWSIYPETTKQFTHSNLSGNQWSRTKLTAVAFLASSASIILPLRLNKLMNEKKSTHATKIRNNLNQERLNSCKI